MPETIEHWAQRVREGDVRAISRALTAIEGGAPEAEEILRAVFPYTGRSYRIGVTGAPGTGKSTLVDRLAAHYRTRGETVGIIAVDPSSPFTGGAILGDRIRMQGHATDNGIYIRSMAARGYLGGLAQATGDAALLLDAAGKQIVLVETVGVGQGEVEIVRLADCTLVVLTPGMGDDVQSLKAGVMEIGDIFVLNKADREGADRFEKQLRAILQLVPEHDPWKPPLVRTVATENQGVEELAHQVALFQKSFAKGPARREKETALWRQRLIHLLGGRLLERVLGDPAGQAALESLAAEVAERKLDPYTAVHRILEHAEARSNR